MLRTDSVSSGLPARPGALRILATRYRGRFLPTSAYDVWMPNLAPSERLLRDILDERITWAEFKRRYTQEMLDADAKADAGNRTIKNHGQKFTLRLLTQLAKTIDVTLLCHCPPDAKQCHRFILEQLIRKHAKRGQ
jgi:uncharacterized protein YeaO (DUF488 family)